MVGALVAAAVIGAVGTNVAANKASKASKRATNAQVSAEEQARAEQYQAYQQSAPGLAQFMMPRNRAMFAESWGGDPNTAGQWNGGVDPYGNPTQPQPQEGVVQSQPYNEQGQGRFMNGRTDAQGKLFAPGQGQSGPQQGGGNNPQFNDNMLDPLNQMRASQGVYGKEAQQQFFDNFQEDPGTAWLREQGQTGINQGASAGGGLGGGSRLKAISEFNQGLANQQLGSRLNNLGGLASTDIGLAGSLSNLRTGLGNSNAASLQNVGAAQAQNAIAQGQYGANAAQGWANAAATGLGAYMNRAPTTSDGRAGPAGQVGSQWGT